MKNIPITYKQLWTNHRYWVGLILFLHLDPSTLSETLYGLLFVEETIFLIFCDFMRNITARANSGQGLCLPGLVNTNSCWKVKLNQGMTQKHCSAVLASKSTTLQ